MDSISLVALMAGLAGTSAMLAFLYLLAFGRAVESRLPLALGAVMLKRMEGALGIGLMLHYGFGIAFGFVYTNLIVMAEPASGAAIVGLGLAFGLVHGIFATMFMIGMAERHPLKQFREAPVASSLAHGVGHLIYGLVVGITIVALAPVGNG